MALEATGGKATDPFVRMATLLAVDGTQPELIKGMLEKWQASLVREQEVKYRKVIEGLMGIQSGGPGDDAARFQPVGYGLALAEFAHRQDQGVRFGEVELGAQ